MIRFRRALASLLLCVFLIPAGCAAPRSAPPASAVSLSDSLGQDVAAPANPGKVVALSASLADLWLLAGGTLAGITEDAVTERDLGYDLSQVPIIGTIKEPSTEKILSLSPDFVIYSPDIAGQVEAVEILKQAGIPCYAAIIDTFAEYLKALQDFTGLTGRSDLYKTYGTDQQEEIAALLQAVPQGVPPQVLFLRASSSSVKAKADGHVVCDILEEAGAVNIAASESGLLEDLSLEAIVAQDPDFIFVATMGSDTQAALDALNASFADSPVWGNLSAVQNGRFAVLPKELYHYKPNAQWSHAYAYLLEILYPEPYGAA